MSRLTLTQQRGLNRYRNVQPDTRRAGQLHDCEAKWAADNRKLTRQIQREQKRELLVINAVGIAAYTVAGLIVAHVIWEFAAWALPILWSAP